MFGWSHFYRLPSVIQILVAEFVMTLCLGGMTQHIWRRIYPQQLSYVPPPLDLSDYVFAAIGIALLIYLLWGIVFPGVGPVSWTPVFHTRDLDVIAVMPSGTVDYAFPTNHPSYVFIDAIVMAVWLFFRMVLKEDPERIYEGNLWVATAAFIPVCRLIFWYVLRRRPAVPADSPAIRDAWKPIAQFYLFFLLPLAVVIVIAVIRDR